MTLRRNVGRFAALLAVTALALIGSSALAQSVQLSPEQQRTLDALPAPQRAQALQAIRQIQAQQAGRQQQSLNEPASSLEAEMIDEALSPEVDEEILRAASRSRLVIGFTVREGLTPTDAETLNEDPALARLIGIHAFVLDEAGRLLLRGLGTIPLLGLDEADITRRLEAESYLSYFDIDVRILDQQPVGIEALTPFGYDLFEQDSAGFAAPLSGPVPADYVLGPGDAVRVQLFGNTNAIYEYEVTRDGILNLPEIGPVTVAGLPFAELRTEIDQRVREMLIGTQVSVTMGPLKTIRVYVVGDVNRPGSYVVDGLATVSTALYQSGGVSDVGTLRNIQVKRSGNIISRFDVYGLLTRGDNSGDIRLQSGDVIFVPPIGNTVAVAGAVKRPAIYEYRGAADVADAIMLAGGLASDAYEEGARLERINDNGKRSVLSVDLGDTSEAKTKLRPGDTLVVPEILPDVDEAVSLSGHVYRPGVYPWYPGMRLLDLIRSSDELKTGVDLHYVLIRREHGRGEQIEAISADLAAAWKSPGSSENIELSARDQVFVFSEELGRQRAVLPIIEEMQRQARHNDPAAQVTIGGSVRAPGIYPLERAMRISDLVRAGGGLSESAFSLQAELTRYSVVGGESRVVGTQAVDLASALAGDVNADIELTAYDFLRINKVPDWDASWTVSLEGEVRFPGDYPVRPGETLAEVLQRAGGMTDAAFPDGAVFLRESLRQQEQEQLEVLARRLESDLTSLSLQQSQTGGSETLATGSQLLEQLRSTEAVGRLVIDTEHLSSIELELRDGDRLMIPKRSQVVTVIGEIQQNTSHVYRANLSRNDYIELSGGMTRRADRKRIYVVRANGAVVANNRSKWLGRSAGIDIRPGDTIVVPMDADKMRPLTFWTNVTQILYQGAIAIAAVRSFE